MNIHFLTYINRSGSTLLAKKIASYHDIGVTIEANWIDGIRKGLRKVKIENELQLAKYLKKIEASSKYQFWNISKPELKKSLLEYSFPIGYGEVLLEILKQVHGQKECYIFKTGSYYLFSKKLWRVFPLSKIVFVERDPRAIYSSQKRSLNSDTGKPMRSNIIRFAIEYSITSSYLKKLEPKKAFHKIKYESLMTQEKETLSEVIDFLDLKNRSQKTSNYQETIPESQQHLHKNVTKNTLDMGRINAWESELTTIEISFLQAIFRKDPIMGENGFKETKTSMASKIILQYMMLVYYCILPIHIIRQHFLSSFSLSY